MICKYCNSPSTVKFGVVSGRQRYWCKECKRKFVASEAAPKLPKMKYPSQVVALALTCYFDGMSLDDIRTHLEQEYSVRVSIPSIYSWVIRFSEEAVKRSRDFQPIVGSTWIATENSDIRLPAGRKFFFWDIMDLESRYLLASSIRVERTAEDALDLMKKAVAIAGKMPNRIITDKLAAYLDGVELTFDADTKPVQAKPFVGEDFTDIIEQFRGTLEDRRNVIRRFIKMERARDLADVYLVYYNFFKKHEPLDNIPPAQKMGMDLPFKDWTEVLEQVKQDMVLPNKPTTVSRPVIRLINGEPIPKAEGLPPSDVIELIAVKDRPIDASRLKDRRGHRRTRSTYDATRTDKECKDKKAHDWFIDDNQIGVCRKCGAQKQFPIPKWEQKKRKAMTGQAADGDSD